MGFAADCNGRKVPGDLCKSYFEYLARMVVVSNYVFSYSWTCQYGWEP